MWRQVKTSWQVVLTLAAPDYAGTVCSGPPYTLRKCNALCKLVTYLF